MKGMSVRLSALPACGTRQSTCLTESDLHGAKPALEGIWPSESVRALPDNRHFFVNI